MCVLRCFVDFAYGSGVCIYVWFLVCGGLLWGGDSLSECGLVYCL